MRANTTSLNSTRQFSRWPQHGLYFHFTHSSLGLDTHTNTCKMNACPIEADRQVQIAVCANAGIEKEGFSLQTDTALLKTEP